MFAGTDLILFGPPEHAPNNSGTSHRAVVIQTAVRGVTVLVCASTGILFHGNVVGSVNSVSSESRGKHLAKSINYGLETHDNFLRKAFAIGPAAVHAVAHQVREFHSHYSGKNGRQTKRKLQKCQALAWKRIREGLVRVNGSYPLPAEGGGKMYPALRATILGRDFHYRPAEATTREKKKQRTEGHTVLIERRTSLRIQPQKTSEADDMC